MLTKEHKQELIKKFGKNDKDTGKPEVQIALLTANINALSEHFGKFKKDNHSRFGLLRMISKRKKLLSYLMKKNLEGYRSLIKELELRK